MSNIVWDAENGWHDGKKVTVTLDEHGRITNRPILWTAEQTCSECGEGVFEHVSGAAICDVCQHEHTLDPWNLGEGERFRWLTSSHGPSVSESLWVTAYDTTEGD